MYHSKTVRLGASGILFSHTRYDILPLFIDMLVLGCNIYWKWTRMSLSLILLWSQDLHHQWTWMVEGEHGNGSGAVLTGMLSFFLSKSCIVLSFSPWSEWSWVPECGVSSIEGISDSICLLWAPLDLLFHPKSSLHTLYPPQNPACRRYPCLPVEYVLLVESGGYFAPRWAFQFPFPSRLLGIQFLSLPWGVEQEYKRG